MWVPKRAACRIIVSSAEREVEGPGDAEHVGILLDCSVAEGCEEAGRCLGRVRRLVRAGLWANRGRVASWVERLGTA